MSNAVPIDNAPSAWPVARYRFTATAQATLNLPIYAGSLLRGVFGAALRRACCMTGMSQCAPCPLRQTCPYTTLFEAPPRPTTLPQQFSHVSNPYIIEPPLGIRTIERGQPLTFHMVLVGKTALHHLPLIVHTWQRALARGLGPKRIPLALDTVHLEDPHGAQPVWSADAPQLHPHVPTLTVPAAPPTATDQLCLHIETPLRLQHNGRPLGPAAITVRALLLAAARRITLLQDLYFGAIMPTPNVTQLLKTAAELTDDRQHLRWHDWVRYSSRQKQEMALGGVIGKWCIRGNVAEVWPWLWLCQWLHIGKNATMGLGSYRVVV